MIGGNNSFGKTICSICYEDLNPIIEDLQSISICGHVFHEICLQQWFEYCTNGKKKNCPVCKQACSEQNANRLYFQSVGDPNDTSLTKKPRDHEEDPRELRNEVKRLEGKVLQLTSTLEKQLKDLKEVNAELFTCKEELKIEATLKNEAVKQEAAIQQLLHLKSKELDRSTLECIRLKDGNMALDRELAALKLSYKELVTKCDTHGRREARSLRKLEKSKEKINKLKTRVQELETALERKEKDNENLRTLRAAKKNFELYQGSKEPKVDRRSYENQNKAPAATEVDLCIVTGSCNDLSRPRRKRKSKSKEKSIQNTAEDIITGGSQVQGSENKDGISGSRNSPVIILDDDTDLPLLDDVTQHQPSFRIRKETSAPVILAHPGDTCFSGGLLGPDGTYWHLGKWCKKVKDKGSGSLS
ncbi:uncharacterized protein LOC107810576 isoform X2 [Nicotiana tabacum]|uniref:Tripartite motif-containing protein 40 isoform X2 n=2 Tax=Nicotiana TaxID=4085 RepID=A0A1S4BPU0_TOBAC|nr:PREDICTED: tripartite motif-containing protein 40-like isoform X2 [Nicotiana sylvestris]XP_016490853.1 PREDICTED: tripartite motif-containing protein 40-like isoform X2 [Nicotiana tabacum]